MNFLKNLFVSIASAFLFFLLIEGVSSTLLVLKGIYFPLLIMETYHTRYDPVLGWRNIPNYRNDNFYGAGRGMRINSQGFRNDSDFAPEVPAGKTRVLCSGDSFTLGFDVDNNQTWCEKLRIVNPRLETVNMGQGGYGLDQMYLWYLKDGRKLKHQVHLFTFVYDDFDRMNQKKLYSVYDKPVLKLEGENLRVENVPVPQTSKLTKITRTLLSFLPEFRFYQLGKLIERKLWGDRTALKQRQDEEQTRALTLEIINRLKKLNEQKTSVLVLVFLPRFDDFYSVASDPLRNWLAEESRKRGIVFIDLVEDFRKIGREAARPYFGGHYTEAGNREVAQRILNHLAQNAKINALLSSNAGVASAKGRGGPAVYFGGQG